MDSLFQFQLEIASYLCAIPAVIMCFLPMHNQLKYGAARTFITFTLLAVIIIGDIKLHIMRGVDIYLPVKYMSGGVGSIYIFDQCKKIKKNKSYTSL